jgi:carboxyl-terminal processing protease
MSRWSLSWFLIFAVAVLVTWKAAQSETAQSEDAELYRLFVDAVEHVDRSYVKEVDRKKLIQSAINGMLSELDPYSNYISKDEFEQFSRSTTGKFGGVGIQVRPKQKADPFLSVLTPVVGTPAYEAGILANDRIVNVDGKPVEGLSQSEVVDLLTGEPGTSVKVSLVHEPFDQPAVDVTLMRAVINIESVLGDRHDEKDAWNFFVDADSKIAYVRISAFMQETAADLRKTLERLNGEGLQGLVIDLRDNPGGLLSSAIDVCDLFLREGIIVSTKGRNTEDKPYTATPEVVVGDVPTAILVNRWSASASEIVSACLQDHQKAVIVGERTFGKGSVQNVIELEGGRSALKLTTASYRRPSGKNIHRFNDSKEDDEWGVKPDEGYAISLTDEEYRAYVEWRAQRDRIVGKGKPATEPAEEPKPAEELKAAEEPKAEPAEHTADKPAESKPEFKDKQLEKALEYIKGKLPAQPAKAA